ncbi:MAG: DUF2971 domain-containing protein [Candidatus Shapirobacteria bacterium]
MDIKHIGAMPFRNNPHLPDVIYKYRIWDDERQKTILSERVVFMASPSSFEDNNDCRLQKRYDLMTEKEINTKYLLVSKKIHHKWNLQQHHNFAKVWTKKSPLKNKIYIKQLQERHFTEFNESFGVLCLTANPNNLDMWNKYSKKGSGFCVGFAPEILFELTGGGGSVDYLDELPVIYHDDDYLVEHFKQIFSKEQKWSYEEEYRTFKTWPNPVSDYERKIKIPVKAYKEVIFGWLTPSYIKEEIKKVCIYQGLEIEMKFCELLNDIIIIKPVANNA